MENVRETEGEKKVREREVMSVRVRGENVTWKISVT